MVFSFISFDVVGISLILSMDLLESYIILDRARILLEFGVMLLLLLVRRNWLGVVLFFIFLDRFKFIWLFLGWEIMILD